MARVVPSSHTGGMDPLKMSQPLGATLMFLGLDRTMPMMHGSQGCSAFTKALSTRHFREPIPLQTTAVTEVTATLGAGPLLLEGLAVVAEKNNPDIIGVMTTGLTEVNGEDVEGELRSYRQNAPADGPVIIGVSTPDFIGGLSTGWSNALAALLDQIPLDETAEPDPSRVAVLVGPGLSSADVEAIGQTVRGFGLDPVLVPDLSNSLDGHLDEDWVAITTGGTSIAQLRSLGNVATVLAIGTSTFKAAKTLAQRTGARVLEIEELSSLAGADSLIASLMEISGGPVPAVEQRWRRRLADGLLDAHFVLSGVTVAIACEPELLVSVARLLHSVGATIVAAVSPSDDPALAGLPCDEVVIGDLVDLEERALAGDAELVIGSSHARDLAHRIGAAHFAIGYPLYDRLGSQLRRTAGYEGALTLLMDMGNAVLDHHREHTC